MQLVADNNVIALATAGPEGAFELKVASAGQYEVKVDAAGFRSVSQPLTLRSGGNPEIRVAVTPLASHIDVAARDKAYPPQLSGTVVDTSGAVIAGATVQVRSANGTVRITTQSDTNGSFIISGLSAGNYRLVVSNPGFETKEIPVTIGTTEAPAPLGISLAVGSVSTTINVEGRKDSLIGIAESATQGTVGAAEIQDRPILRSGEV